VIVFTHRLSFSCMLTDALEKHDSEPAMVSLEKQAWGTGEPCGVPIFSQKPKLALNTLIHDRLTKATHVSKTEGSTACAIEAKALCSDLRIAIERLVETELLAEVVLRFRWGVQTYNRIHRLAHITLEDCTFLDGMMTKYSRYEHSQPAEAPISSPEPDELRADLDKLLNWQLDFSQRSKTPPKSSVQTAGGGQEPRAKAKTTKLLPPEATPR
jgi:hypothetical protein